MSWINYDTEPKKWKPKKINYHIIVPPEKWNDFINNENKFDIVYMVDVSDSMEKWIRSVQNQYINISKELNSKYHL